MSLKPKLKKSKNRSKKEVQKYKTVSQKKNQFYSRRFKLEKIRGSMIAKINEDIKYSDNAEVTSIEAIRIRSGGTRIRVVAYVREDDTLAIEGYIHRQVERLGKIGEVWEPGLVDEGWEFNYILKD